MINKALIASAILTFSVPLDAALVLGTISNTLTPNVMLFSGGYFPRGAMQDNLVIELLPGDRFSGIRVTGSMMLTMVPPAPGFDVTTEPFFNLLLEGSAIGFPGESFAVPVDLNVRATFPRTGIVTSGRAEFSLTGPQVSTSFHATPYTDGQILTRQEVLLLPTNYAGHSGFLFNLFFDYYPVYAGESILVEFPGNGLYVGPVSGAGTPEPGAATLVITGLAAALGAGLRRARSAAR